MTTVTMGYWQRWKACDQMRRLKLDPSKDRQKLVDRAALRKKIQIPKDQVTNFQITFPAGYNGLIEPETRPNHDNLNQYDAAHEKETFELELNEARMLRDVWMSIPVNDEEMEWHDPIVEQLKEVK